MKDISITLVDPQVGFCLERGSLARRYGVSQLSEIGRAIPKIHYALMETNRRHLVKSEYAPGQFTEGDLNKDLSNLCVPYINDDCEILEELSNIEYSSITTKNQQSALSSNEYCREIEKDLVKGINSFVVSGFLLNHCVKQTAVELALKFRGMNPKVYVCSDLTAARLDKYKSGAVEETIAHFKSVGIEYVPWIKVQP